jgi:hypothetical protein
MSNRFEDFLVEKGARALAAKHGHDPDAMQLFHDGVDMRKPASPVGPWWEHYRNDAEVVIAAIFDRSHLPSI